MNKTAFFAALLLLASVPAAAGDYARYYESLPLPLSEPQAPVIPETRVSVVDFGGVGDGVTLNTEAFGKAIAALDKKQSSGRALRHLADRPYRV